MLSTHLPAFRPDDWATLHSSSNRFLEERKFLPPALNRESPISLTYQIIRTHVLIHVSTRRRVNPIHGNSEYANPHWLKASMLVYKIQDIKISNILYKQIIKKIFFFFKLATE